MPNVGLIQNLQATGVISSGIFSLYLDSVGFDGESTPKGESNLMVGDWDLQKYAEDPNDGFKFHDVQTGTDQWVLTLNEVNFNGQAFLGETTARIDPGVQYIYGPTLEVLQIYTDMRTRHLCNFDNGFFYCFCSSIDNNPDLEFYLDNEKYSISSKQYQDEHDGKCFVYIIANDHDYWVFGEIFLRKYYSLWDYNSLQIGFTTSINNPKTSNKSSNVWVIILVVVLVVVVLGGALIVLFCAYKRKKLYRASLQGPIEPLRVN